MATPEDVEMQGYGEHKIPAETEKGLRPPLRPVPECEVQSKAPERLDMG